MVAGGPWVAKIDEQPVCLVRRKVIPQPCRVAVNEKYIGQLQFPAALHRSNHGIRNALHCNVQHFGVLLRCLSCEAAFPAAQFQPQLLCVCLQIPPMPTQVTRLRNQQTGTRLHPRGKVGLLSHSHLLHLVAFLPFHLTMFQEYLQSFQKYTIIKLLQFFSAAAPQIHRCQIFALLFHLLCGIMGNRISGCSAVGSARDLGG